MLYHGFYIRITPLKCIKRETDDGKPVLSDGFCIDIFESETKAVPINSFTAAVGFEITANTIQEAEYFAKDVVDNEEKEYFGIIDEMKLQ